jgi:hypothetical protein
MGSSFNNDTCSLVVRYLSNDGFKSDTLLSNQVIQSDHVLGLANSFKVDLPNKSKIEVVLWVNDYKYLYRFDKYCKKTQIRIDYQGKGIDIFLKFKGGFKFY